MRTKEELTELVKEKGFDCRACKHRHSGEQLAYICIGCPCEYVPDWDRLGEPWPEIPTDAAA